MNLKKKSRDGTYSRDSDNPVTLNSQSTKKSDKNIKREKLSEYSKSIFTAHKSVTYVTSKCHHLAIEIHVWPSNVFQD